MIPSRAAWRGYSRRVAAGWAAEYQSVSDLAVGQILGDQAQHLEVWLGQGVDASVPTSSARSGYFGPVTEDPQKHSVLLAERALQAAMLAGDVDELDPLLHPELVAVGPDGQMIDKPGDLAAHRSGVFKITELREEELRVTVFGDLALTFVVLDIRGTIDDADASGRMRYTRTWVCEGGAWQVIGAHTSPASP